MSPSSVAKPFQYGSNKALEKTIEDGKKLIELKFNGSWIHEALGFLIELRERRQEDEKEKHKPVEHSTVKKTGKIHKVTCSCGTQVNYKTPLNNLDDFICPEQSRKER